jgi:RND family efflux transporter MFP subunit
MRWKLSSLALAALLAGCAGAVKLPDTEQVQSDQALQAVSSWQVSVPHSGSSAQLMQWWAQSGDAVLIELMAAAQKESATLAGAQTRIAQARAGVVQADQAISPQLSVGVQGSRAVQAPKAPPASSLSAGFQAAWELDLWGGNKAALSAAQLRQSGAELGWHEARIAVAAETASAYFAYRYCENLLGVLKLDTASREETARLAELSAKAGFTAPATAQLARASSVDAASQLTATQAQCDAQVKAMVALSGIAELVLKQKLEQNRAVAGELIARGALFSIANAVGSVPAQMLAQRPDVAAAQAAVASAALDARSADARRYPTLALNGSVGVGAVRQLGVSTEGLTWSLGPVALNLPLTNQSATRSNTEAAVAAYNEAVLSLRAKARQAVSEVESSLIQLNAANTRSGQAKAGRRAAHRTFCAAKPIGRRARSHGSLDFAVPRHRWWVDCANATSEPSNFPINSHKVGPMNFKKHPIALVLIAFGALSLPAIGLFSSQSVAQPAAAASAPAPKAALSVTAVSPSNGNLALKLSANGSVAAWQEASIGAEVNGLKLTEVRVNVGDVVKRGQVLARFSAEAVQADLLQAKASLAEAQAALFAASADAQRAATLKDTGALSAQQIAQFNTQETTAKARLQAAQAMVTAAQVRANNAVLTAPDNGVISARNATVGSVVGAGAELFRMVRQGRLEWRAEVTSSEIAKIKPGAAVSVTAASGAQVNGKVRIVAPTVDPVTRNALVYVDIPQHTDIKAGMYAKGEFALGSQTALTLPQQALVLRDGFTYAMRIEANNKVVQVKLQTGKRSGDAVEILSGVKSGERFVASGAAFLADGDTVRVIAK